MERSERLELISTLIDSEKSDEDIKDYFKNTLNLELSESTLYRDIKQVRDSLSSDGSNPEDQENAQDSLGEEPEEEESDSSEEEESEEAPSPTEEDQKADDEPTIANLMEAIKEDRSEEIEEDARRELGPVDHIKFKRLLNIAKGRIELEISEQKAEEARKERKKFLTALGKNVNPAIKGLKKSQEDIQKAIKFKRKHGKNTRALVSVNKVLNRQIKSLERQVNG